MRVAVATGANAPLILEDVEIPEPGPGEVLVRITACGVCYSDLNLLLGHYPFARFPVIPGHEINGVVTPWGTGSPGRRSVRLCKRITGVVVDGGYAEYALLKAGYVTPLPAGLDPVAAAPLMCAGLTAFNGLRQGGARAGSRVAVIGAGGIGALAVRYAVAMGARVAVIGRSPRGGEQAKALGADLYVATSETDPVDALKAWAKGADLILNTAPSTEAAAATLGGLAPDGTLLLCGYGPEPLVLPTQPMVLNRLRVAANPSGSPHDLRDTLAFSAAHGILPEVTPITLDEAPATLDAMVAGTGRGRRVIAFA
ncbi:zinc-binding dehydrogenase [Streptomyces sp. NPDC046870]|uniref:alcohol dehydrogenase catalytic domain-containing protein n=1 Tax=Streptomyces sp. NPDC046870 TaxID=3155135 RepID=UPI003453B7D8